MGLASPRDEKAVTDNNRLIEAIARAICGRNCDMPKCTCQPDANSRRGCRELSMDHARNALAAIASHGLAVVPREPTEEMREAGQAVILAYWRSSDGFDEDGITDEHEVWSAMLDASPTTREPDTRGVSALHSPSLSKGERG